MPAAVLIALTSAASLAVACSDASGMTDAASPARVAPARPARCKVVAAGTSVQSVLDDPAVSVVCLEPGLHGGPLRLARAVTLWGPPDAIVRGPGGGVIDVVAPGAVVLGLSIDGSEGRFDRLDAAVRVMASDTRIQGVTVINAVFGISVERASRVTLIGNHIHGSRDPANGLRGDTIRLWETRDSLIANNVIEDGRDLVVWYSRGNVLRNNHVRRARYGLHFMYSHDNQVRGNELVDGVVGIFVMYSRGLMLDGNLIANAGGAAGMAIGIKDSGNIFVTGNLLVRDMLGVYVDSSPMQRGDVVEISRNVMRLDDTAIVFHASAHGVRVIDNDFADNTTQVRIDGGGDATDVEWSGNYFDDYTGYDLDSDGFGDVAYELRSFSNQLTASHPNLALFRGTAALAIIDAASHLDPLYQPKRLLADPRPRMSPRLTTRPRAQETP